MVDADLMDYKFSSKLKIFSFPLYASALDGLIICTLSHYTPQITTISQDSHFEMSWSGFISHVTGFSSSFPMVYFLWLFITF